jgi:hypothetical protein
MASKFERIKLFNRSDPCEPPRIKISSWAGLKPKCSLASLCIIKSSKISFLIGFPVKIVFLGSKCAKAASKLTQILEANLAEIELVSPGTASDS